VHELPTPIVKQDTTVCLEDIGNLALDGGENYGHVWSTGETSRYIRISQEGVYKVTTQNIHGCERTDSITVTALCGPILYIPEAFSPNGDGKNDLFKVFGRYIEQVDIMIYNRWGTLVFHSNKLENGWNGDAKGQPVNAGVFRCKVVYRGINGTNKEKQAMIHLVR
jgi:gliding motility-associated-like protein